MKPRSRTAAPLLMACGMMIGTPAAAAEMLPDPPAAAMLPNAAGPGGSSDVPASNSPFTGSRAIEENDLDAITGRAEVQQTVIASNSSNVSGNSVTGNSVTGTIAIDGQALQNLHGLSVLTANTGNNVSINSSMNVNVAIHP